MEALKTELVSILKPALIAWAKLMANSHPDFF